MGVDSSDPWEKTKRIWKNTVYNCKSVRQKVALTDKKGQDVEQWFLNCCEISIAQQKKSGNSGGIPHHGIRIGVTPILKVGFDSTIFPNLGWNIFWQFHFRNNGARSFTILANKKVIRGCKGSLRVLTGNCPLSVGVFLNMAGFERTQLLGARVCFS